MSGFLRKYLFYQYCKNFFYVILVFFPIIYFSDFLLSDSFNALCSLMKVPFRYGQIIGVISFLGSYLAVTRVIYIHGLWVFISLKYKKKDFMFSLIYLSLIISLIFYVGIVPFNDRVFDYKEYVSKWAIVEEDNKIKFFYNTQKGEYDIWEVTKGNILNNYQKSADDLSLSNINFYIVWNETKKMSFKRLEEYKMYMDKNGFGAEDYYKQKHIYYSRFLVIFVMSTCGYILALKKSFWCFLFCFLVFNWMDLLAFFLPLKYCILFLWCNVFVWLLISLLSIIF